MLEFLLIASFIITILLVWFQTNAIAEYLNILGFSFLLKGFNDDKESATLVDYLTKNRETITKNKFVLFILKLITCAYCFNFWLAILGALVYGNILFMPLFYVTSLYIYFKVLSPF